MFPIEHVKTVKNIGHYMNASGGVLPTLIDEQQLIESENEDWVSKSSTVVRIAQMPSLPTSHEEEDSTGKYSAEDQILEQGGLSSSASGEAKLMCCGKLKKPSSWFTFYLCAGMLGFVIFWLVLMLRIYLPETYWTWSYIWS